MRQRPWETLATCLALLVPVVCAAAEDEPASLIVVGGRVWTGEPAAPWAEAIAVRDDRILAVGSRADMEALAGSNTATVDAAGGFVAPGFIDSHVHLFDGGRNLQSVQLRDAATREEFVDRIARFAAQVEPGEWILGGDWDHTRWGGELPTRDWIDEVTPHHPVWIQRLDGHMALANSLALRRRESTMLLRRPTGRYRPRRRAAHHRGVPR